MSISDCLLSSSAMKELVLECRFLLFPKSIHSQFWKDLLDQLAEAKTEKQRQRSLHKLEEIKAILENHDIHLDNYVYTAVDVLGLNDVDKEHISQLCSLIHTMLESTFPSCSLQPFGSSVTGLSCDQSDLDLSLHFRRGREGF